MDLYPAIDLRGGRCVRLAQGDFSRETVYRDDPVAVARSFAAAGAPWIHVVDLDAALTGTAVNADVIGAVARSVDVPVQAGGGVRSEEAAASLLAAGVSRVVVGTAALSEPGLVRRLTGAHPGAVAVGLDHKRGEVVVRGWTEGSGRDLLAVVAELEDAGAVAFVVTDVERDGMLEGPDRPGLATVLGATTVDVIASGGVSGADDVRALAGLEAGGRRLSGVIVGRALYEGRLTVEEGVAACAR
ncbi:MAG TPA: 1-(5-phosphoribosyl)-5-[(5-phosphoribosylamino)methylideneamino]imidazole-4-carboxamide isomerase [Acidimicrobiales bacterium]|nr:1-(5-phosphoribosyl)-5-[(5-phosphoribosylamino)methylideneamino]imidazole-4-carboxamide isomerase [Acidimicrobiales bacterium]